MNLLQKVMIFFFLCGFLLSVGCDSATDDRSADENQATDGDVSEDVDVIDSETETTDDSDTFDALPDTDSDADDETVDDILKKKTVLATISGKVRETVFRAPYLFVAAGYGGLYIYEKKQDHLELIKMVTTPYFARSISVENNHVYLGCGKGGVVIIDVSNPTTSSIVATVETTDFSYSLFVQDSYLFVADGKNLVIVDVTNPENPKDISVTPLPCRGDIFVGEKHAYITDDNGELGLMRVVDISDLTNPQQTDIFETDIGGDITIKDKIAYGSFFTALKIIDVSNPYNLAELSSIDGHTFSSCLYGNHLYSAREDDVVVYNITNPETPTETVTIKADFLQRELKVSTSENNLYLSGVGNLSVVDISQADKPVFTETVWLPTGTTQIYTVGDYLYTVSDSSVIITDISKPTTPQPTTSVILSDITTAFSTEKYTYIASESQLYIYETTDKTAPMQKGTLLFPKETIRLITAENETLFVATENTLYSVDVSTSQTPQIISESILTHSISSQITLYEDYLYLQGKSSIAVYTVDKDKKATFLKNIDDCEASLISDGKLFTLFGNKLTIYSLQDGATVNALSHIFVPYAPMKQYGGDIIREIHRYKNSLYITEMRNEGNALIRVDISDVSAPQYIESSISTYERCSSSRDRYSLAISKEYAYTLECSDIIDIIAFEK